MSIKTDRARLDRILHYIQDIESIVHPYKSIGEARAHKESQYALMLCFSQIGELLNRIESPEIQSQLPVKDAVAFRNIIVHDYDGINLRTAENTIAVSVPELKRS